MKTQWWLAEIGLHNLPRLSDGPHSDRNGVEEALYLIRRLGLGKGKNYCCAKVILTDVEAKPHNSNEDALKTLNEIGLR